MARLRADAPDARVPVRLSLSAFDPRTHHDVAAVASRLDAWIARQLTADYAIPARRARALVKQGWILPVLDGLDEMDAGTGPATRALEVLQVLNEPVGGRLRPCVIACRPDLFGRLGAGQGQPASEPALRDAAVIELRLHSADEVIEYIISRFPQGQSRWGPVLDRLWQEPDGPLAQALRSPLRLFLAVAAYYQPGSDPAELVGLHGDEIDRRLFSHFIPAVTRQHFLPDGARYDAADVTRWMRTLALQAPAQNGHGPADTDFDLATPREAADPYAPSFIAAASRGLLVALALFAGAELYVGSHLIPTNLANWVAYIVGSAIVVAYTVHRASRQSVQVRRLDLGTASGRRRLINSLGPGVAAGLVGGLAVGPTTGLALGLAITMVGGLTDVFAPALSRRLAAIRRPRHLVSQGVAYDLTLLAGYAAVGGLVATLAGGLPFNPAATLIGLAFGFAAGAVNVAVSPWLRGGARYDAADVTRLRRTLASQAPAQNGHGPADTDFDLATLWRAAGPHAPSFIAAASRGLLVALALFAGAELYVGSHLIPTNLANWVAYIVGSAIVVAYTVHRASRQSVQVRRLDLSQLSTASGRRRLINSLGPGVAAGLVGGLAVGPTTGLALGLAITIVGGITDAFVAVLTRKPVAIRRPSDLVSQGVAYDLTLLAGYAAVGGLVATLAGGLPFNPAATLIGLAFGFAAGAVNVAVSPWLRYFAAMSILARGDLLPARPAQLLDWAYDAGLLRLAGVYVQFRHRELQEQLVGMSASDSRPHPA